MQIREVQWKLASLLMNDVSLRRRDLSNRIGDVSKA